jgi:choline dehydrogenase
LVCVVQPGSVGWVGVRAAAPAAARRIDPGIYGAEEDVRRVVAGVRTVRRLAGLAPLRDLLVAERAPGPAVADEDLAAAVRAMPLNYHHPVGTCRMGPDGDPGAVLDATGRVRGVEGLFVIDAAAMPVSPRATTHLPVVMLAERAAAVNWTTKNE